MNAILDLNKSQHLCRVSIEFLFYFNLKLVLKIEATCDIARIIKSGCNLIARKRLASTKTY